MNYSVLPPEINSLRMFTGAGSAPMLAASVAWDRLAAELAVAASSFGSVTSGLAGQSWQGAAAAMAAAAAPYAGWLAAAAARAAGASAQAKAVASAFEAARAATVHPMLVAANRNAFVQLVLSNLFGQNAPAIAAAEAMYEQMWAADVAAMVGYHGGASAAAAPRHSAQTSSPPASPEATVPDHHPVKAALQEIQADMGINAPQMSARLYAIGILQISLSKCPRSPRRGETMRCERIVSGRGRGG